MRGTVKDLVPLLPPEEPVSLLHVRRPSHLMLTPSISTRQALQGSATGVYACINAQTRSRAGRIFTDVFHKEPTYPRRH